MTTAPPRRSRLSRLRRRPRTDAEEQRVMTLTAHLAELRNRLLIAVGAIVLGAIAGLIYYNQLFEILLKPYETAAQSLDEHKIVIAMSGIATPLIFQLQVAGVAGIIISSP